ncbi:MAG: hypothetical protein K2W96_00965 [Gemmataceae bacterium]|nr:hypothetical protein [Gemmataceae bacterium]
MAALFVAYLAATMPLTAAPPRRLVPANLLTTSLIAGLAGCGALVALGGQPIVPDEA